MTLCAVGQLADRVWRRGTCANGVPADALLRDGVLRVGVLWNGAIISSTATPASSPTTFAPTTIDGLEHTDVNGQRYVSSRGPVLYGCTLMIGNLTTTTTITTTLSARTRPS